MDARSLTRACWYVQSYAPHTATSLTLSADRAGIASTPPGSAIWNMLPGFGLGYLTGSTARGDSHLSGEHVVRMSPISTAKLNPYGETFCLASPSHSILVPLLLNNTSPATVRYSLVPLGYVEGSGAKVDKVDLSAKDLKAIETARLEALQAVRASASKQDHDDYDEYDDDEDDEDESDPHAMRLQKTQSMTYIRISKPGTLRLDRVLESSNVDARLVYPREVTVVPCPRAEFVPDNVANMRCATPGITGGTGEELNLEIDVYGVPPLSLRWYKEIDGKRESFMVEGIESSAHGHRRTTEENNALERVPIQRPAAELRIPLTVSLDSLGTHSYVLESVTDALGNIVYAGSINQFYPTFSGALQKLGVVPSHNVSSARTRRSVSVLRRPSVLFEGCGPGTPVSLLIGSDAPLVVSAKNADTQDGPWDVRVHYEPLGAEDDSNKKNTKRHKPWTKDIQLPEARRDVTFRANEPGEYTLVGLKGRFCEGDILSPDTCKVVERPYPTAEIEWKKIHEWSVLSHPCLCCC